MGEPTRFTDYTFEIFEGLPPEGESSFFVGFAADWEPFLLRWGKAANQWLGAGFQQIPKKDAFMFRALWGDEAKGTIKRYARLPVVLKEPEGKGGDDG
jgi:hypothetical protein